MATYAARASISDAQKHGKEDIKAELKRDGKSNIVTFGGVESTFEGLNLQEEDTQTGKEDIKAELKRDGKSNIVTFGVIESTFEGLNLQEEDTHTDISIDVPIQLASGDTEVLSTINQIPQMVAGNPDIRGPLVATFSDLGTTLVRLEKKDDEDKLNLTVKCTTKDYLDKLHGFYFPSTGGKLSLPQSLQDIFTLHTPLRDITFPLEYSRYLHNPVFVKGYNKLLKIERKRCEDEKHRKAEEEKLKKRIYEEARGKYGIVADYVMDGRRDNVVRSHYSLLLAGKALLPTVLQIVYEHTREPVAHSSHDFKSFLSSNRCKTPPTCQQLEGKPSVANGWCTTCEQWSDICMDALSLEGEVSWPTMNTLVHHRNYDDRRGSELSFKDAANILSILSSCPDLITRPRSHVKEEALREVLSLWNLVKKVDFYLEHEYQVDDLRVSPDVDHLLFRLMMEPPYDNRDHRTAIKECVDELISIKKSAVTDEMRLRFLQIQQDDIPFSQTKRGVTGNTRPASSIIKSEHVIQHSATLDHRSQTVNVPHTNVSLEIPEKAVPVNEKMDVTITVHMAESCHPPLRDKEVVVGPSVCIEPHGVVFLKPVTVTIPHSVRNITSKSVTVWTMASEASKLWHLLFNGRDQSQSDADAKATVRVTEENIQIRVTHFCWVCTLLSYFTGTESLKMQMRPFMYHPFDIEAKVIYVKVYALKEYKNRFINSLEEEVGGIQRGEMTPFDIDCNGHNISFQVKMTEQSYELIEAQKDMLYERLIDYGYNKCTYTFRKLDLNAQSIHGLISANQGQRMLFEDSTFTSKQDLPPGIGNYAKACEAIHVLCHRSLPTLRESIEQWHNDQMQVLQPCSGSPTCKCVPRKKPTNTPGACQSCIDWTASLGSVCYPTTMQVQWKNVDGSKFHKDPVEVAKAFLFVIPPDQQVTKFGDFDVGSILKLMMGFGEYHKKDQACCDKIEKILKIRNALSHMKISQNMELSEAQLNQYFDDVEDLVKSLKSHQTSLQDGDIKERLQKIKQSKATPEMIDRALADLSYGLRQFHDEWRKGVEDLGLRVDDVLKVVLEIRANQVSP